MVLLSSSYILFILALSAFSAPVPNPQDPAPVTPAELTTPSQGGTFDDFKALPSTEQGPVTAPPARRLARSGLFNRAPIPKIPQEYRRFFPHGGHNFDGDNGDNCESGFDCFDVVAPPAKGPKPPPQKGVASPPALAHPHGGGKSGKSG